MTKSSCRPYNIIGILCNYTCNFKMKFILYKTEKKTQYVKLHSQNYKMYVETRKQ